MKTLNIMRLNFYRLFTSISFYVAVAMTFGMCFTGNIRTNPKNNMPQMIIELIFLDKNEKLNDVALSFLNAVNSGGGVWFYLVIPIIAAFPFIPLFTDERESKFARYSIIKTGKYSYNTGNFLSAFLASGLTVALGYVMFVFVSFFLFPTFSEYETANQAIFDFFLGNNLVYINYGTGAFIGSQILVKFFYGALWSLPAFILSAMMRNKYLIMCIPLFLHYGISQTSLMLQSRAVKNFANIDEDLMNFAIVIYPDGLNDLFASSYKAEIITISSVVVIVCFILFNVIMNRRIDLGD